MTEVKAADKSNSIAWYSPHSSTKKLPHHCRQKKTWLISSFLGLLHLTRGATHRKDLPGNGMRFLPDDLPRVIPSSQPMRFGTIEDIGGHTATLKAGIILLLIAVVLSTIGFISLSWRRRSRDAEYMEQMGWKIYEQQLTNKIATGSVFGFDCNYAEAKPWILAPSDQLDEEKAELGRLIPADPSPNHSHTTRDQADSLVQQKEDVRKQGEDRKQQREPSINLKDTDHDDVPCLGSPQTIFKPTPAPILPPLDIVTGLSGSLSLERFALGGDSPKPSPNTFSPPAKSLYDQINESIKTNQSNKILSKEKIQETDQKDDNLLSEEIRQKANSILLYLDQALNNGFNSET